MRYLCDSAIDKISSDWEDLIEVIEQAIKLIKNNDYVQPLKSYLRYNNLKNRMIAMPAFAGKGQEIAGLKWIASFPDNIKQNLPRANSVTILNDTKTGAPIAIINSPKLSSIRTAAVSGFVLKKYLESRNFEDLTIGIIGFGPIGRDHYRVCKAICKPTTSFLIFDKDSTITKAWLYKEEKIFMPNSLEETIAKSDVLITCTNTLKPYITQKPKKGALILNVSLRDFVLDYFKYIKHGIIIDDWDEVNREGTLIEILSKHKGLREKDVNNITLLLDDSIKFNTDRNYIFCPMGLALFDIMIANYYLRLSIKKGIGIVIPN